MNALTLLTHTDNTPLAGAGTAMAFSVFGCPRPQPAHSGLAGHWLEPGNALMLLGAGRRAYLPSLMRFAQADQYSPFDLGGANAYSYCQAEPVNHNDPSGAFSMLALKGVLSGVASVGMLGLAGSSAYLAAKSESHTDGIWGIVGTVSSVMGAASSGYLSYRYFRRLGGLRPNRKMARISPIGEVRASSAQRSSQMNTVSSAQSGSATDSTIVKESWDQASELEMLLEMLKLAIARPGQLVAPFTVIPEWAGQFLQERNGERMKTFFKYAASTGKATPVQPIAANLSTGRV